MDGSDQEKVISFNERHYRKLMQENSLLKRQLQDLVEIARENQLIQDHLDALELRILQSQDIWDMGRSLIREMKKRFGVEVVKLFLSLDPHDVLHRFAKGKKRRTGGLVTMYTNELLAALPRRTREPILGEEALNGGTRLLSPRERARLGSAAIVPLFKGSRPMGVLLIGSKDPQRYGQDKGTEFLRKLAAKVTLVADNVLAHQRLEELSVTDQVTGLYNRRLFEETLTREVDRCRRHNVPLSCMMIDIDGFKAINDRYGHHVGDEALRHLTLLLKENVRRHDVVARFGGDEIAILLTHTPLEAARKVAQKHLISIRSRPLEMGDYTLNIRVSIGLASLPEIQAYEPEALVRETDRCLYEAKERGGNQVVSLLERQRTG